jgi:hypothetical protein
MPVSAGIVPAAPATPASPASLAYCQVTFQLQPAITIEVGLPLNAADGGTGGVAGGCGITAVTNNECLTGNWNGKIEAIGNGGYAGDVPAVTPARMSGSWDRRPTMVTAPTGAMPPIRKPASRMPNRIAVLAAEVLS